MQQMCQTAAKQARLEKNNESPYPQTSKPNYTMDSLKMPIRMPKATNSSNNEPARWFLSMPNG